jgi:hypothetical protein
MCHTPPGKTVNETESRPKYEIKFKTLMERTMKIAAF